MTPLLRQLHLGPYFLRTSVPRVQPTKGDSDDPQGDLARHRSRWKREPFHRLWCSCQNALFLQTRFENERGTNPEELIAAAHAGCLAMALAFGLQKAGYTPTELSTEAVTLISQGQGFRISRSALSLRASVPNIDETKFTRLASDVGKPVRFRGSLMRRSHWTES